MATPEQQKKYYEENKDEINRKKRERERLKRQDPVFKAREKERLRIYRENNRDKLRERAREHNKLDHVIDRKKKWANDNHDKVMESRKKYNASESKTLSAERHYKNNGEVVRDRMKQWKKDNREKVRYYNSKRRDAVKKATPTWLSCYHEQEIEDKHLLAIRMEEECGEKYHVDHAIPLTNDDVCGLHVPWNMRVISATSNMKKKNKFTPFAIKH